MTPEGLQLFSHQEVLEELLRMRGIKKGRWILVFELQHVALNIRGQKDPNSKPVLTPASIVMIQKIGIAPTDEVHELSLDAAELFGRARKGATAKVGKKR